MEEELEVVERFKELRNVHACNARNYFNLCPVSSNFCVQARRSLLKKLLRQSQLLVRQLLDLNTLSDSTVTRRDTLGRRALLECSFLLVCNHTCSIRMPHYAPLPPQNTTSTTTQQYRIDLLSTPEQSFISNRRARRENFLEVSEAQLVG